MEITDWSSIVGQKQLTDNLKNAIKHQKVSHAYMIQGEKLSGKKMIADIFARALQCESDGENKPCNQCRACKQTINRNNPDVIYVSHEKPNTVGVNDIRTQINGDISIKPYSSARKIYIIDEAEKMNTAAQNALLKTLEEPPEYAVIILLTTNVEVMLQTILSRCVVLGTKPVSDETIQKYIIDRLMIPDYKARVCSSFARGNIGRAIELASNEDFDNLKKDAIYVLKNVADMEVNQIMTAIKKIPENNYDIDDYIDICFIWFRDVLLYKSCKDTKHIVFKEEISELARLADRYSYNKIECIIRAIELAKNRLKYNVNQDLTMEMLFMEMR